MSTIAQLLRTKRFCYFIPLDGYVEGQGWRPSVVFEGEEGHYPNGDFPYEGKPGQKAAWFWGHDYNEAVKIAAQMNEEMGISSADAFKIVTSSMAAGHRGRRSRRGAL